MVADLTAQVGLCMNGTTTIARLIQWFTRSKSYHVVVAWTPDLCVSAEPGGVLDRTNADETHAVWSRFDLTSEERAAIIAACKSSEKLPYNYAVYPILAISRLTHIPVPKFVADWLEGRRNVDCSQLAAQIYAAAGLHLFVEDSDIVTPGDWERKFRQLGFL